MRNDSVIRQADGNLLNADVDALVNTVNTVGIMGKGIALQFKRAFPAMFKDYAAACKRHELTLGRMHVWPTETLEGPRFIINFPTKAHWKSKSRLRDIEAGLDDLRRVIEGNAISSIALPPLGCGHGGLDWADVEPLIQQKLGDLAVVDVLVYAPVATPSAAEMRTVGPAPIMTAGRAALVALLARYLQLAVEGATQIEIQKLMYFLQVAGQPLALRFEKNHYGPYADNLRAVLRELEGHYLLGFGDGSRTVAESEPFGLLPGAHDAAMNALEGDGVTFDRIERVMDLVAGYESSYSLELLATVHWVITQQPEIATDPQCVVRAVHAWSARKEQMFPDGYVEKAIAHLLDRGWLSAG